MPLLRVEAAGRATSGLQIRNVSGSVVRVEIWNRKGSKLRNGKKLDSGEEWHTNTGDFLLYSNPDCELKAYAIIVEKWWETKGKSPVMDHFFGPRALDDLSTAYEKWRIVNGRRMQCILDYSGHESKFMYEARFAIRVASQKFVGLPDVWWQRVLPCLELFVVSGYAGDDTSDVGVAAIQSNSLLSGTCQRKPNIGSFRGRRSSGGQPPKPEALSRRR